MKKKVEKSDIVVLVDSNYKKFIVDTDGKTDKIKGVGVIDPKILIGANYGKIFEIGNKEFYIFEPSIKDKLDSLKRKAQIILPRDAAHILMNCSIQSGQRVLESGIGSGALTIALASTVAPNGKVISYDNREDFIKHAKKNLFNANLDSLVEVKLRDVTKGIEEKDLDAIILDIPNPWNAIKHAYKSLKPGGYLCSYSPLSTQVEKTVLEIKKYDFIEINTIENIQRNIVVSEKGIRPSFNMLGHTGYLSFARKVLERK